METVRGSNENYRQWTDSLHWTFDIGCRICGEFVLHPAAKIVKDDKSIRQYNQHCNTCCNEPGVTQVYTSGRYSIHCHPAPVCRAVVGVSGESARLGRLTSSFIPRDELLELANKVTLCGWWGAKHGPATGQEMGHIHTNSYKQHNHQQPAAGCGAVFSHSQSKTMSSSQLCSAVFSCVQLCGCCGDERRCGHGKNGPGSHCPGSIIILGRIVQEHCICSILRLLSASGVLPSSELGTPVSNHHQTRWAFWERYKRGKRVRRRVYFIDYIVCITFSCVLSLLSN